MAKVLEKNNMTHVDSLDRMEEIVKNNKFLHWDGWDVLSAFPNEKARVSANGARVNKVWCMVRRFPVTESGWDIPKKLVR